MPMHRDPRRWLAAAALALITAGAAAQEGASAFSKARASDTARSHSLGADLFDGPPPAPDGPPLAAPKMKGDEEFGEQLILARRAQVEPWSISLDAQYFFTDNVALVPEGEIEDFYLRAGFSAQYANRVVGDWFVDAGLSSHHYLHDQHDFFDFHLLRAEAGVTSRLAFLADVFASAHYAWFRISDPDLSEGVFQDHIISVNVQKVWKRSRGQQIVFGLGADFSLAPEPAEPGRHEYSAYASYKLRLTERISVQAGYRGAFYDYTAIGRQDWNHSTSLGCSYDLNGRFRVSVSGSASFNRSSASFFDYDNIVSGAGVSFHLEF